MASGRPDLKAVSGARILMFTNRTNQISDHERYFFLTVRGLMLCVVTGHTLIEQVLHGLNSSTLLFASIIIIWNTVILLRSRQILDFSRRHPTVVIIELFIAFAIAAFDQPIYSLFYLYTINPVLWFSIVYSWRIAATVATLSSLVYLLIIAVFGLIPQVVASDYMLTSVASMIFAYFAVLALSALQAWMMAQLHNKDEQISQSYDACVLANYGLLEAENILKSIHRANIALQGATDTKSVLAVVEHVLVHRFQYRW